MNNRPALIRIQRLYNKSFAHEPDNTPLDKLKLIALLALVMIWILGCVLMSSCSSEECPFSLTENFDLTPETFSLITYDSATTLIFEDSEGNEVFGQVSELVMNLDIRTHPTECPFESGVEIPTRITSKRYTTKIFFQELDQLFTLGYQCLVNRIEDDLTLIVRDKLTIVVHTKDQEGILTFLAIVTDARNDSDFNRILFPKDMRINGNIYQDVYYKQGGSDVIDFYYSFEKGLVGFHDKTRDIVYNLVEQ